jgi:hypothetical protein
MIENPGQEGTPGVKRSGSRARVKVSADGKGVVSHAGRYAGGLGDGTAVFVILGW